MVEFDREPKFKKAAAYFALRGLETDQPDPRFPNCNQARHCSHSFSEFKQCSEALGEDHVRCQTWKKIYKGMCPTPWIERFQERIDEDRYLPYAGSLPIPPLQLEEN